MAGIGFELPMVNEVSKSTPQLCKLRPAGDYHIEDLDRAGGISAVMKELNGLLKLKAKTVTGKTVAQNIAKSWALDSDVIRSKAKAHSQTGGLAVLFGNLAPEGAEAKALADLAEVSELIVGQARTDRPAQDLQLAAVPLGQGTRRSPTPGQAIWGLCGL